MNRLEKLQKRREKISKELYEVNLKIHYYNEINEHLPSLEPKKRRKKKK